jgi:hypothetical protein
MICGLLGRPFHIRHDVFTKNGFGIFNEQGEWNFGSRAQLERRGEQ